MTIAKYFLFIAGQIGMMSLARFLLQWIIEYSRLEDSTGNVLFVAAAVGGTVFAFRIFDGITDPIAGTVSDRWVRRGKRRQTLLLFAFVVPAIGLILTFLPNHDMTNALRWGILASGLFIFFVGYTFYAIPYWSLVDDYSNGDEGRRRLLSNLLGAGLILATAIGFGLSPVLVEKFGFTTSAIIFAAGALVLMPLPFFAAPADAIPAPPKPDSEAHPSLWQGVKIALQHRRFIGLTALFAGSQMSFTVMTAAASFIAIDLLGGELGDVPFILGPLFAFALPCFFLVPAVSRKIGWEKGMMLGSVGLGVIYCISGSLGMTIIGSPIITAAILFSLGGPMVALLFGLEGEGVVACARERGGKDTISIYWGVFNLIVKSLNGIALFITGWLTTLSREYGVIAIRSMSFVAGGCLLLGVIAYFIIKRGETQPPAPEAT
ncbi:MAG: GPH family glycoside/pentoside/hexuronide:cation symporter [Verrucomicrobiales bacterium]|jgi:GPH family glycoside/pentoside/hexuronide:cation symporter